MKILVITSYNPLHNVQNEIGKVKLGVEFDIPDDATDEQIEEAVREAALEDYDCTWRKVSE